MNGAVSLAGVIRVATERLLTTLVIRTPRAAVGVQPGPAGRVTAAVRRVGAAPARHPPGVIRRLPPEPEIEVLLRARILTGSWAEAEDLVQDTLMRAHRGIDRFDGAHPAPGC